MIFGAYYPKLKVSKGFAAVEIIAGTTASLIWFIMREGLAEGSSLNIIEPMIIGVLTALVIHLIGIKKNYTVHAH